MKLFPWKMAVLMSLINSTKAQAKETHIANIGWRAEWNWRSTEGLNSWQNQHCWRPLFSALRSLQGAKIILKVVFDVKKFVWSRCDVFTESLRGSWSSWACCSWASFISLARVTVSTTILCTRSWPGSQRFFWRLAWRRSLPASQALHCPSRAKFQDLLSSKSEKKQPKIMLCWNGTRKKRLNDESVP